ncbi:MAG: sugar-binding protein [Oscillospiraceae bacterium]|nr:sugar-binding protein [Oscillospiraceae bacterium]
MKKLLLTAILSILILCLCLPISALGADDFGKLSVLPKEIEVDGVKDAFYDQYGIKLDINRILGGKLDVQGKAYFICSEKYLYIFIEVSDKTDCLSKTGNEWDFDCCEYLFNPDSSGLFQYRINSDSVISGSDNTKDADFAGKAIKVSEGYNTEFRAPRSLISSKNENKIALALMITDIYQNGSGNQNNIVLQNTATNFSLWSPDTYGFFSVGDIITLPAEPTETETEKEEDTTSPSTGDSMIIFVMTTVISLAVAITVSKKKI